MTPELTRLVTEAALSVSDRPVPTAVEHLSAMNKLAEAAYELGHSAGFAAGVVRGSTYTATVMDRVLGAMR